MASAAERLVVAEREARDAARARLEGHIERLRGDFQERGIGGRIADEASAKAFAALDEAARFAGESKGIIGGTLVLVLLWLLRRPLISAFQSLLNESE